MVRVRSDEEDALLAVDSRLDGLFTSCGSGSDSPPSVGPDAVSPSKGGDFEAGSSEASSAVLDSSPAYKPLREYARKIFYTKDLHKTRYYY